MKKKIIALIIGIFLAIPVVKADSITISSKYTLSEYTTNVNINEYEQVFNEYITNYANNYPYYIVTIDGDFNFNIFAVKQTSKINYKSYQYSTFIEIENGDIAIIQYYGGGIHTTIDTSSGFNINVLDYNNNGYTSEYYQYEFYDSNVSINFLLSDFTFDEIRLTGFYSDTISLLNNQPVPKLKNLIDYNSWSDYENDNLEGYREINLDNYNYIILTLKNYNQTNAFTTNLQVKGQIGITPIYNYGQTSKDDVTGVKVQDRCNVSYQNYTTYPLYILQQDLQNNAVYVVKECSSNSSFKYDENMFNITYITEQNENDPKVVINGKTYNVIPYDELPSTATQNEEENYIPGESGSANDTGGLDSAIKNAQNKLSEIWNTITYFTDFIGQIFSSLPDEVRGILISGFTIMIVLGVIKIFLGK